MSTKLTCDNFDLAERLGEGPPWGCDSVLWKPCGVLGAGGPWGSRPAPWWCRWCPMLSYWLCWANMAASRSPMLTAPIPDWIFCIFWMPAPPLAAAPLEFIPRLPSAEAGNGTPWPCKKRWSWVKNTIMIRCGWDVRDYFWEVKTRQRYELFTLKRPCLAIIFLQFQIIWAELGRID